MPWKHTIDVPAYPFAALRDWLEEQGVTDALDDVELESAAITEWARHIPTGGDGPV